jgi:hypothetical protein
MADTLADGVQTLLRTIAGHSGDGSGPGFAASTSRKMANGSGRHGGRYRRYCDDLLVMLPTPEILHQGHRGRSQEDGLHDHRRVHSCRIFELKGVKSGNVVSFSFLAPASNVSGVVLPNDLDHYRANKGKL